MSLTDELAPCPFCGCSMPADGGHEPECYFTKRAEFNDAPPGDISGAPAILAAWNRRAPAAPPAPQPGGALEMLTREEIWDAWSANRHPGPLTFSTVIQRAFIRKNGGRAIPKEQA